MFKFIIIILESTWNPNLYRQTLFKPNLYWTDSINGCAYVCKFELGSNVH